MTSVELSRERAPEKRRSALGGQLRKPGAGNDPRLDRRDSSTYRSCILYTVHGAKHDGTGPRRLLEIHGQHQAIRIHGRVPHARAASAASDPHRREGNPSQRDAAGLDAGRSGSGSVLEEHRQHEDVRLLPSVQITSLHITTLQQARRHSCRRVSCSMSRSCAGNECGESGLDPCRGENP